MSIIVANLNVEMCWAITAAVSKNIACIHLELLKSLADWAQNARWDRQRSPNGAHILYRHTMTFIFKVYSHIFVSVRWRRVYVIFRWQILKQESMFTMDFLWEFDILCCFQNVAQILALLSVSTIHVCLMCSHIKSQ